jgi:hypothetical protein
MKERTQLSLKLIVSHIVLIIGLITLSIFQTNYPFFALAITQTVLCILYFSGYWEFFGLRFKKIFCVAIELIILSVFVWKLSSGSNREANVIVVFILALVQFYLLYELIRIIRVIYERETSATEIEFPFNKGNYLITDGGNSKISRLMNYHYYGAVHKRNKTNNSMLYATDIVKIAGSNSKFLPITNEEYPIFNENIYSPMGGEVVKVVNGIPDNEPFSGNYPYNTGNTVVVKKEDLYFLMGHLKKDSIVVKEGDVIQANDLIGTAGNSGWTERPHLHMQLIKSNSDNYWSGKGVCIRYRNKNLYKNRLIKM